MGVSKEAIAGALSLSVATLYRHAKHYSTSKGRTKSPELPTLPPDVSPKDRVVAHLNWLENKIKWAEANNAPTREIAQLSAQYTSACKHEARLSGALDVTETQILRSTPWTRIMNVIRDNLKSHPVILQKILSALEVLDDTGN